MQDCRPTEEEEFAAWEQRVFGCGYGSGEEYVLASVKAFFEALDDDNRSYTTDKLEKEITPYITWLLVNIFDKHGIIDWGTSARMGWLTASGECLRDFISTRTVDELCTIVCYDRGQCQCGGSTKGHEWCGKNKFLNNDYAYDVRQSLRGKE